MKISKNLEDEILKFSGEDGFFHSNTGEELLNSANYLLNKGLTEEEISKLLWNLYSAISNEYGN